MKITIAVLIVTHAVASHCEGIHGPYQYVLYGRYLIPGGVEDSSRYTGTWYGIRRWKLQRSRRRRKVRIVRIVLKLHLNNANC